jgi:phosphatidylglycerophosphate synthase
MISLAGMAIAALGGLSVVSVRWVTSPTLVALIMVAFACCIQLRLLCNLFDGMVGIEGGLKTKSGELYNELPDRFSDACFLIGAGYSQLAWPGLAELGWLSAWFAVTTAYVRAIGTAAGAGQHFLGPMAKQHRMALLTAVGIVESFAGFTAYRGWAVAGGLVLFCVGCLVTIMRRACRIARVLETS